MPLSISVGEVRRHVAFLERVHDDALNHASALYRNNVSILCAAVDRCHSETGEPSSLQRVAVKGRVASLMVRSVRRRQRGGR